MQFSADAGFLGFVTELADYYDGLNKDYVKLEKRYNHEEDKATILQELTALREKVMTRYGEDVMTIDGAKRMLLRKVVLDLLQEIDELTLKAFYPELDQP